MPRSPFGRNSADKEKGVALLFTLGFLALLLVLALAFATTSITQKKMASNNNDTVYAKMLSESALQRVIGVLQSYDEGAQYSHCDSTTHPLPPAHPEYAKNYATLDWLHKLGTANAFYWYDSYATPADINWEYVKQYDSDSKTDKITGRVAYVVIPGGGLDPVKLVKDGVDEGASYPETRKGVEMNEINIKSLDGDNSVFGSTAPWTDVTKFNYVADNGLLTPVSPNGTWIDFENMFSLMSIPDSDTSKRYSLRDWFVLDTQPEAEAFWRNNAGNSKIDFNPLYPATIDVTIDELFHRFNLARFTDTNANGVYDPGVDTNLWDTITLNDIIPNIKTGAGTWPTTADVYVKPSAPTNGSCIPWLEDFGDAGTFPDPAARSKQIAANLIDYCDSNSAPTTDYTEAAGIPTCTYMGNERTPYINELVVEIHVIGTQTDMGSGDYKLNLDVKSSVGGELINMYGDNFAAATLTVAFSVTGTIADSRGGASSTGANQSYTLASGQSASITIGANSYKYDAQIPENSLYSYTSGTYTGKSTVSFKNVSVTITSAKLEYPAGSGIIVDFVKINKTLDNILGAPVDIVTDTTNDFENRTYFGGIHADDPRQNINSGDWSGGEVVTGGSGLAYGATPGANGTPNATNYVAGTFEHVTMATSGKDTEVGNDPSNNLGVPRVSTAYIRNDIMQSPWELGAIHRGAKWETINLKEYNKKWGVNNSGGGNKYYSDASDATFTLDGGDANILDQIKMTPSTTSDKKLNLKLHKDSVLYSLFHKVKLGQDYATFSGGSDLTNIWNFNSTDPGTLVYQLKEKNINFYSRGCLAEVTRLFDGITCGAQSNDRQKEEIIGKVINLTGISTSDYFTIIVLAQTIKDIGGVTIRKDLDMNGQPIGTASELVLHSDINGNNNATDTGISETITNCDFGAYDQYADEILAEQKIKAELYRDPDTKKIKILRYEYIEE